VKEEKTQIFRTHKSEAAKKDAELRYEEALPWHLEDADGTNVWVGQYVSALAHTHVAFHVEGHAMRMLPVEKFYKFVSKPNHKTFTIEEVEQLLDKKKMVPNRWIMKGADQRQEELDRKETRDLLGGGRRMIKTESSTFRAASRAEKMEHDDLDISGDEFQDDDETTTFERNNNDEDEKEAKERIRRDQLGAVAFGEADEREMQRELKEIEAEAKQLKEFGKSTKKALIKRDQNRIYASDDSEEDPWGSSVSLLSHEPWRYTNYYRTNRAPQKTRTTTRLRRRKMPKKTNWAAGKEVPERASRVMLANSRNRSEPVPPACPSLAETNLHGTRSSRLLQSRVQALAAVPALRLFTRRLQSARPTLELDPGVTERPQPVRCQTVPDPRRS
jgi:transcription initiation factor TFIIF subunit alpha